MSGPAILDWMAQMSKAIHVVGTAHHLGIKVNASIRRDVAKKVGRGLREPKDSLKLTTAAGLVTFWVSKLKPLSIAEDEGEAYLPVNEAVALLTGMAIAYGDEDAIPAMPDGIISQWINNLRYDVTTPQGVVLMFDLLKFERPA